MSKTIAMMQPYWFPYFGYFQLIASADTFVLGDNLQYMSAGWVNRNRFLSAGEPLLCTLPLKKGHLGQAINQRELSDTAPQVLDKILKTTASNYARAPHRQEIMALLEPLLRYPEKNLARYLEYSLRQVCDYLKVETPIHNASSLPVDESQVQDKQDRVVKLTQHLQGTRYLNTVGGMTLYDGEYFERHGIELRFQRMDALCYTQFKSPFVPNLSIIDMLMFNPVSRIRQWLQCYSMLPPATRPETTQHAPDPDANLEKRP